MCFHFRKFRADMIVVDLVGTFFLCLLSILDELLWVRSETISSYERSGVVQATFLLSIAIFDSGTAALKVNFASRKFWQ